MVDKGGWRQCDVGSHRDLNDSMFLDACENQHAQAPGRHDFEDQRRYTTDRRCLALYQGPLEAQSEWQVLLQATQGPNPECSV